MGLAHKVKDDQRTRDIKNSVDVNFSSMLLLDNTLEGLNNCGFYKPSPIQLHGIPLGKCGFDLILEAKSGTGKTAVFTVIALEQLDLDKGLQTVILAPTREIATQVRDVIKQIGSCYKGLNVEVVIGGLSVEEDIQKFKKNVHILVGSPGRMRYLIQDKHVNVSTVRLMVLDEADKLMDKSFQADINYIYAALPKQKQVITSSATYPDISIMQNYVKKGQHICPDSTSILLGIKQYVTFVDSNVNVVRQTKNKFEELIKILSKQEFKQCLIFCNYQVRVGELCKMLKREKWPAEQLHGQLEQTDRLEALRTLQEYKCRILVSTDLAARGIDASNVDIVINFESPYEWQTYLHRIGRAGRFGSFGRAITILSKGSEETKFKLMMKCIGSSINMHYFWSEDPFQLVESDVNNPELENQINMPKIETSKQEEVCTTKQGAVKCEISTVDELNITSDDQKIHKDMKSASHLQKKVHKITPKVTVHISTKISQKVEQTPEQQIHNENEDINTLLDSQKTETPGILAHESRIDCTKRNEEYQTFDILFESFEKSKCKIESFNELITSFEEFEPNNNEIEDIIFKNNFDDVLNTEIKPNIILELNSDTDIEENKNYKDSFEISESNTSLPLIGCATNSYNETCSMEQTIENYCIYQKEKSMQNEIEYVNTLDTSTHKALMDAGLPTAFGSSKHSNKTVNEFESKVCENKKNKHKLNSTRHKDVSSNNRRQQTTVREINVKSSTDASTSFDDGYNTHSGLLSRSTKYFPSHNHRNRYSHTKNDVVVSCREKSFDNVTTSDFYRKYNSWYRHFKMHVHQVEMSLYIDELSKV